MKKLLLISGFFALFISCQKPESKSGSETKGETKSATSEGSKVAFQSEDGPFGKFKEPVTITMWVRSRPDLTYPEGDSFENNQWTRGLSNELNMNMKYIWNAPNGDEFNAKINTSLAAGELPDFMPFIPKDMFPELAKKGALADLTEAYDKFASPELRSNVDAYDGKFKKFNLSGGVDGKIYGLNVPDAIIFKFHVGYIRKNWLDALGLPVPTTLDELYTVMDKFSNEDPDKNGINDTIGMAMGNTIFSGISSPLLLFAAYDSYPKAWVKQGDTLVYSALQDNTKTALTKLHELYEKNAIPKEFPAISTNDVGALITKPKAGIFMEQTWGPPGVYAMTYSEDDKVEWIPFKVPRADGNGFAKNVVDLKSPVLYAMSSATKYPESIVKLFNFIFEKYHNDPDYATMKRSNGEEAENNLFGILVPVDNYDMDYKNLPKLWDAIEKGDPSGLSPRNAYFYKKVIAYKNGERSASTNGQWFFIGPEGSVAKGMELENQPGEVLNEYLGYPTKKENEKMTNMESKMQELFTNIIMGAVTVDEGWAAWQAYWNDMGGKDLEKMANDWYSANK